MKVTVPPQISKVLYKSHRWYKNASRKKKILIIVLGVLALLFIFQAVGSASKPPPYTLVKTERSDVTEVVAESGSIFTGNSTAVYSPTNGIIEELFVSNGDVVEEGDELFTVKSTATPQEQFAAYSNYLTARASLDAAEASANSLRSAMYAKWKTFYDMANSSQYENENNTPKEGERLAAEFQISQDDWLAAERKYKDNQTALAQARAAVNSTLLLYEATKNATVTAPVGGTVANLASGQNGSVRVSLPTVPASPVLLLANFSAPEAVIALGEADAAKVSAGQQVVLDVNAVDDTTYQGVVLRVDDIGIQNQGVVNYNAYIAISNPDSRLKAGMTVDVDITTKKLSKVITVPNAAVKPYKGGRAVRILDPKTKELTYVPVLVGVKGTQKTQIIKGLQEGQEVVTSVANDQIKRPSLF